MRLFGRRNKLETSVYNHPSLGDVTVARNPRARRLSISIRAGGRLRLTIPRGASLNEGLRFLESKSAWVASARERLHKRTPSPEIVGPPYSTRRHTLALRAADIDRIRVRIADGVILITHPVGLAPGSEPMQNAMKRGIEEAWRIEARDILPRRVAHLAREHGFRHGEVTIRNTVSKWGSCSARNDLSLSLHLMRLPDHLIDYIILHELCHTVHHDHSAAFHALLGRHTEGRHLALRKELRTYNTRW